MSKMLKSNAVQRNPSHRRSLRRINKLFQKNLSQFKIPNPYKNFKSPSCLPESLSKQLLKLDYLSIRILQGLHFQQSSLHQQMGQLLLKMKLAAQKQQQQYNNFLTVMTQKLTKQPHQPLILNVSRPKSEISDIQQNKSIFIHKEIQNSVQEQDAHELASLPIQMHQFEGVSMMSDNYEADKLEFHFNKNFAIHNPLQLEQQFQSYQI